ncbi:MAG TPA: hypothetical protein VJK30_00870 [Coxiellaceae bacterium]|nr:MAG: hypothetical protein A3E81_05070 [Gammaproteobacteria bacterium RIFCSPHIGHO2_12_FULL_36_30]HLB55870.1 hypothetical protein [Coxiellaceae bacterium]
MSTITIIIMLLAIIYFVIIPSFKTRVFHVKKLIIMPAVFMYLNYQSVTENFHIQISDYGIITLALIAGILIGALLRKNTTVKSNIEKKLIELPGSYFSLIIFLAIFAVHFVIGYLQSVNPTYLLQASFSEATLLFLLTASSSMTIGANAVLFYKYVKHSKNIDGVQQ